MGKKRELYNLGNAISSTYRLRKRLTEMYDREYGRLLRGGMNGKEVRAAIRPLYEAAEDIVSVIEQTTRYASVLAGKDLFFDEDIGGLVAANE